MLRPCAKCVSGLELLVFVPLVYAAQDHSLNITLLSQVLVALLVCEALSY